MSTKYWTLNIRVMNVLINISALMLKPTINSEMAYRDKISYDEV